MLIKTNSLKHIAIIPDGNRRWARERGLPTFFGHKKGFDQSISLSKKSRELGIKILTFWAFSTENWKRSKEEVNYLMKLYEEMIDKNLKEALREKVRIIHLGRKDRLNQKLKEKIIDAEEKTKHFNKYYLTIALDYGGVDEILRTINKIKKLKINNLDEKIFEKNLDTKDLPYPNPDLVIRTSGEVRTSGFMIWQTAYSEWIFYPKYFPDFTPSDLEKCVKEYQERQRRFGK
ncbi:MAG: polyprenyl diphosphate synthase [Patescibacteria group bacterium]|nr:polyprenyl diphosphate synthase [Patescibacteria group bacterium]